MSILPVKLYLKTFDYARIKYVFDQKNYNIFEVSDLFEEILYLAGAHTDEEIVVELTQQGRYSPQSVQNELDNLKDGLSQGSLSYQNIDDPVEIMDPPVFSIPEDLWAIEKEDFQDLKLLKKVNQADYYLLVWMNASDLENEDVVRPVVDRLAERYGRYRINIQADNMDLVNLYHRARSSGLTNFDFRFLEPVFWTDDELEKLKELLIQTIPAEEGPYLAVIRDILRVLGFQQQNRCYCQKDCWGCWICGSILGGMKESSLCNLYRVYFEVGIMHYLHYLQDNPGLLKNILSQDLQGKYTSQEKGILSKNYYWRNNIKSENFRNLQHFRQQINQKVITYYDCQCREVSISR